MRRFCGFSSGICFRRFGTFLTFVRFIRTSKTLFGARCGFRRRFSRCIRNSIARFWRRRNFYASFSFGGMCLLSRASIVRQTFTRYGIGGFSCCCRRCRSTRWCRNGWTTCFGTRCMSRVYSLFFRRTFCGSTGRSCRGYAFRSRGFFSGFSLRRSCGANSGCTGSFSFGTGNFCAFLVLVSTRNRFLCR